METQLGDKLKAFSVYFLVFIAAVGFFASTPLWRDWDWQIMYQLRNEAPPPFSHEVILVDVPYDTKDLEVFRGRIADLLHTLSSVPDNLPLAVVLDMYFASDEKGLKLVENGIIDLKTKKVPVYAAIKPGEQHAESMYTSVLRGFGHTQFEVYQSTLKYSPYLSIGEGAGIQALAIPGVKTPALAVRLAEDIFGRSPVANEEEVFLSLGAADDAAKNRYHFDSAQGGEKKFMASSPNNLSHAYPDFRGKLVVVGSGDGEVARYYGNRTGPEILAWAISDRMLRSDQGTHTKVLTSPTLLMAMMLAFGALSSGVYYLVFQLVPRLKDKLWGIAVITATVCLSALAAVVGILRLLDIVYPMVTLVGLGIVVAALLPWHYFRRVQLQRLEIERNVLENPPPVKYDVFISYSNNPENLEWVVRNVYEPLSQVKKPDGSLLDIFFDKKSIRIGTSWYLELAYAIHGSRFFVPVYSRDYFQKPFCFHEMHLAAIKHVAQTSFILPICRENTEIPLPFQHIQCAIEEIHTDFIERISSRVLEYLET